MITEKYTVPLSQLYLDDTAETPLVVVRETFAASVQEVWEALTESQLIKRWGAGETKLLESDAPHVMVWTAQSANATDAKVTDGPYAVAGESFITLDLKEGSGTTYLTLSHARLPERRHDQVVKVWESALREFKRLLDLH